MLFFVLVVTAQDPVPQMTSRVKVFGRDFRSKTDVKGIEYGFKDYVQQVGADTASGLITLQILNARDDGKLLTDDGSFSVYDPAQQRILWTTGINYQNGGVDQVGNVVIKSNLYDGRQILDLKTGSILWKTKQPFFYTDPGKMVGLTYSNVKASKKVLAAIDLKSGKELWTRQLDGDVEWRETLKLNSSTIAVVASGLHTLNIETGAGWDHALVTNGKGKASNISSNIVHQGSKIYFASSERLVCLTESGEVIWSVALTKELMSKSHLFIRNNALYLVNRGLINPGSEQIVYGKPFFACYALEDGRQKFFTPSDKKEFSGLEIRSQAIALISGNSIMKYSLVDGHLVATQSFDINKKGALRYFAGDLRFPAGQKLYRQTSDSVFHNLVHSDSSKLYVITSMQQSLVLDSQLKLVEEVPYGDLYAHYGSLGDLKLLNNAEDVNKTFILDRKNKPQAELKASYDAILIGKTLYDSSDKKFMVIDLSGVPEL
jgi:hypothetical protein